MSNDFNETINDRNKNLELDSIPQISFVEFQEVINHWMLIIDPGVVKLLVGTILANLLRSDPVWLFLIGPSSGGKTELLNAFLKYPQCYFLSQLSPNTFLSGYKSKDKVPSLLHQLGSGKTIIFKDFTSLLEGNKDAFKEIMGQLREIFDGHTTKRLGTGDEISWRGKLGFIAGCTPILEQRMNLIGAMGERFLSYSIQQPKRSEVREKMRENIGKEDQMREEIQNAMIGLMKGLSIPKELPILPQEISSKIEALTDFICVSRAVVMRGFDSKKEIEYVVEPEGTGRTYKQLYTIAIALMIINGGTWNKEDSYILHRLAICSVHSSRYKLINAIRSYKTKVKTSTLAVELGLPTSTTRRYLEDLSAIAMDNGEIKILNRVHQGTGKPDLWSITIKMNEILNSMGDKVEAIKEDSGFGEKEQDIPVGAEDDGSVEDVSVEDMPIGELNQLAMLEEPALKPQWGNKFER